MTGWNTPRTVASLLSAVLVLASAVNLAEEGSDAALPEDFLEFLADWEDEQGQWQDPLEYEDPEWLGLNESLGQGDE